MTSQGGMHNLTTLIKRLEAATSRLEDIASSSQSIDGEKPAHGTSAAAVSRAASVNGDNATPTPTTAASPRSIAPPSIDLPKSIEDFDQLIQEDGAPFQALSVKLGGPVAESVSSFLNAFKAQRTVLLVSTKAKKPSETAPVFMDILRDLQKGIMDVDSIRDKNRKGPEDNHLVSLVEGSGAFSWMLQPGKPDEYIGEVLGGARMYSNRILTEYKDKNQTQVEWVNSFVKLLNSLKSYSKTHFPRGLIWNANGVPAEEALNQVKSQQPKINGASPVAPAPPASGGAPPPPPPPLPPAFDITPSEPQQPSNDMGAVFAELNRGEAVTSGLKKVDKSQMTHKNPALRSQETIQPTRSDSSSSRGKSPAPSRKPESLRAKKPSRKELEGNKWTIENFESEASPITIQAEKQQSILVSRCKSVDILINGKANGIIVDNCQRVNLLLDTLVSAVEAVNCSRFNVQVSGTLPSVQLDKVDQCSVYLSEQSLRQTGIYTSKCSAVNIVIPPKSEEGDSAECPVPEQLKSYVDSKGQLVTEVVKQEG